MVDGKTPDNPATAFGWTGGQFSLARYVFGTLLAVLLIFRAAAAWRAYPDALDVGSAGARPSWWPTLDDVAPILHHPALVITLLLVAALMAFFVAAGNYVAFAAIVSAALIELMLWSRDSVVHPGLWPAVVVLVAFVLIPGSPYGSIAARGRDDPAGGWRLPMWAHLMFWVVLGGVYLWAGVSHVIDADWRSGKTLGEAMPDASRGAVLALTWSVIVFDLAFVPLALWRVTRPWVWLLAFLQVGRLMSGGEPGAFDALFGLAALHLFTFQPTWLRGRATDKPELLFYDGHCGLCHGAVRFVLSEDADGSRFAFAPLQSDVFNEKVSEEKRASLPDSIVLLTEDGRMLTRSSAVVRLLSRLGGLWRVASWLLWVVPKPLRDLGYTFVAMVRRKVFKTPSEVCPVMPGPLRDRFQF